MLLASPTPHCIRRADILQLAHVKQRTSGNQKVATTPLRKTIHHHASRAPAYAQVRLLLPTCADIAFLLLRGCT